MQALERLQPGIAEIEIGKQTPHPDPRPRHDGIFDLAEPAEEPCGEPPWDPVGQQEVDVLLLNDPREFRPQAHGAAGEASAWYRRSPLRPILRDGRFAASSG